VCCANSSASAGVVCRAALTYFALCVCVCVCVRVRVCVCVRVRASMKVTPHPLTASSCASIEPPRLAPCSPQHPLPVPPQARLAFGVNRTLADGATVVVQRV
jgi:hypothetical protein